MTIDPKAIARFSAGPGICRTEFTVTKDAGGGFLPGIESDLGIHLRLVLFEGAVS